MRYLLLLAAVPGSGVLFLLVVRSAIRTARRWRTDDEDRARALRIQHEYGVTADAVEEPRGRRAPVRERPETVSRYDREVSR